MLFLNSVSLYNLTSQCNIEGRQRNAATRDTCSSEELISVLSNRVKECTAVGNILPHTGVVYDIIPYTRIRVPFWTAVVPFVPDLLTLNQAIALIIGSNSEMNSLQEQRINLFY